MAAHAPGGGEPGEEDWPADVTFEDVMTDGLELYSNKYGTIMQTTRRSLAASVLTVYPCITVPYCTV